MALPPRILQIVRERLRPGVLEQYGEIEEQLLRACRTLSAPNRYLALVSALEPIEVWWLNMYDSRADVDRIGASYAANAALMTALRDLAAKKEGMTDPPLEVMTCLRRDLSGPAPWRIGELRYAAILKLAAPAASAGAVFEAPDGSAFVFLAAASLNAAEELAAQLGPGTRIFEIEPKWSLPQDEWVLRNPKLWKP